MRHAVVIAVVLCLAAGVASAATFRAPDDAELLGRADLVVVATVTGSVAREAEGRMVYTDHHLRVEEVVKGSVAAKTIVVSELGGFINGHGIAVPGAASYARDSRVVAFLRQRDDGTYFTAYMALGKYRFADAATLVRDADGIEVDDDRAFAARPAKAFLDYIRAGAPKNAKRPEFINSNARPETPVTHESAADYVLFGNGRPLRWNCPSACTQDWTVGTPQAGSANSDIAIGNGMAAWTNEDAAWITLAASGTNSQTGTDNDDVNDIVFNSNDANGICDAGIGCGIVYFNGSPFSHTFDGSTWNDIISSDVIVRPGDFGQSLLDAIVAHELGHAIGLDHAPSGGALMSASVPPGATLREYDVEAVSEVYGEGVPCSPPNIISTSGAGTIFAGNSRTLSVNANGTTPLSYQWYRGESGDTANPVGTNSSIDTGALSETTTFWVKVTNECGTDESDDIVVTVEPCDGPEITVAPQNQSVTPGSTATLTAEATGTEPLVYQWFRGALGQTSNPVGTNSNTYTTPPLTTTTTFWLRVGNPCGQTNTDVITITVGACTAPAVTTQPQSQSIATNTSATLTVAVNGTSPLTYQWYRGNLGDISNPVGTNSNSFTTPALTANTTYWVRISNICGTTDSAAATITVGPACVPVTLTSLNTAVNIGLGETATLAAVAAGETPIGYQWFEGESGVETTPLAGATSASVNVGPFATAGARRFWVKMTNRCSSVNSPTVVVTASCLEPVRPQLFAPPVAHYTSGYDVEWTGHLPRTSVFEVQEARDAAFTIGVRTFLVTGALSQRIDPHTEVTADTRFYYRARAISACTQVPTSYSPVASTVVTRPEAATSTGFAMSVPEDATQPFTQDYLVPGFGESATNGDTFSITTDAPWLTVFPASGALSAGGTTVQLRINPALVEVGSTTATVIVNRTQGSGKGVVANATTPTTVPVSVSKVTPVTPAPRSADAPPGTLIIPAIAHADGVGTRFQSDVRIVNVSSSPMQYELSYTPSGSAGTETGKKTTLTINPQESKGLDDIVKAWYGSGVLGELGIGTLEIRPLAAQPNPLSTFASSRTYAISGNGTLGQFIPAIGIEKFSPAGQPDSRISLQQIANTTGYRTNLGFVEGSGTPVTLQVKLIDGQNRVLQTVERSLPAYGHQQTNFTSVFGNVNLPDGRVEVEVISAGGKATAYASVVDNSTSDPLMVFPVQAQKVSQQHWVVPGVAEFDNGPSSNFHTDMRIYNAAATPVNITLGYYPQAGDTTPRPANVNLTLAAGETRAIDNVLPNLWKLGATGGAVAIDAPPSSKLVVTARTYSRDSNGGTYGQFIPGATGTDGVGRGERSLEVLQLEQSAQYRTNLGLVEVTGNPVKVEILARTGNKLTALTEVNLSGNEFRQLGRIFNAMGFGSAVYTGRISVRVVEGNGRVVAYGSVIDNRTVDPTYVPAQ